MSSNQRTDSKPLLIVQVEPPQEESGGDFYYRTYAPGIAMAREQGVYVINLTNAHRKKEELIREADVCVLKNICDPDMLSIIRERKQRKKLTVYELADDLCAIPPWNPVHFFYKTHENLLLFKRLAHYCDAMQFSVPELRKLYGYLNPCSVVFPNQLSVVPTKKGSQGRKEVIIGWGGSHGHLEDMSELSEPLIDWIISRDNVKLYLMCSDPIWRLFDRIPHYRKRRFKPGALKDYYTFLGMIDIGIAPLRDTAFNRSRSDVKYLEYAVYGVVPVVQDSIPYISTVKHGETGFLFQDAANLLDILGLLVDNPVLRHEVTRAARHYVIKERLQHQHAQERITFYRQRIADLGNGNEEKNRGEDVFQALSSMEGAVCNDRYVRLTPTRFENLLHNGLVLGQVKGNSAAARSLFSEAAMLEPHNYLPYLFGASYSGDSIGWLNQAIEHNPNSVKSWILLGEEHARRGDIVSSIKCFESAAEIFPEYEIPYLRTAFTLQKSGYERESRYLAQKAEALIKALKG